MIYILDWLQQEDDTVTIKKTYYLAVPKQELLASTPTPSGNSGLASCFSLQVSVYEFTHPLRNSNNLPPMHGYFLELHIPEPGSGCDLVIY